jgi:hypothetical protein
MAGAAYARLGEEIGRAIGQAAGEGFEGRPFRGHRELVSGDG